MRRFLTSVNLGAMHIELSFFLHIGAIRAIANACFLYV